MSGFIRGGMRKVTVRVDQQLNSSSSSFPCSRFSAESVLETSRWLGSSTPSHLHRARPGPARVGVSSQGESARGIEERRRRKKKRRHWRANLPHVRDAASNFAGLDAASDDAELCQNGSETAEELEELEEPRGKPRVWRRAVFPFGLSLGEVGVEVGLGKLGREEIVGAHCRIKCCKLQLCL